MSAWPGKFVLGLTGNIATGKSVVRRMLEELGADGIDADQLAHQAIAKGKPAYYKVVDAFGEGILNPEGEIFRPQLAEIVFRDAASLVRLEAIIHPEVHRLVDAFVSQSAKPVVVIEAIKLIEAGYPKICDSIWVTVAPLVVQIERLTKQRGMSEELALQRILAQPSQEEKIAWADVIIHNDGSLEATRSQVQSNWNRILPATDQNKDAGG